MSNSFGANLREIRKQKGLTTTACASAIHVTQPAWNQWELGLREPKLDYLIQISKLLETPTDILLGISSKPGGSLVSQKSTVVIGNGNVISNGSLGSMPCCSKCPVKKKLKLIEKAFMKA